jgi:hypothetical protein
LINLFYLLPKKYYFKTLQFVFHEKKPQCKAAGLVNCIPFDVIWRDKILGLPKGGIYVGIFAVFIVQIIYYIVTDSWQ